MITNEELKEIEARLNAATPGPWTASTNTYTAQTVREELTGKLVADCSTELGMTGRGFANHAFIANAPTDIRKLLDEVKNQNRFFKCDWCNKSGEEDIYPLSEHGGIDDHGAEICEGCRAGAVYADEEA